MYFKYTCQELCGDNLLHCERSAYRVARHDEQIQHLVGDLWKAALHPVLEPILSGDIEKGRTISIHGGSDLFDITLCHPLTLARIRDSVQYPLSTLKAAWPARFSRYASVLGTDGTTVNLIPVPFSNFGGWHPDS